MKKHPGEVERHSITVRIIHWTHTIVTTVSALTGLYLSYPPFRFGPHSVGYMRLWHLVLAPLIVATSIAHIYLALVEGSYRDLTITAQDLRTAGATAKYELLLAKTTPSHGKYNVLQKMLYLSFVPVIVLQTVTGLALAAPPRFALLIRVFHGLQVARHWHFLGSVYLVATGTAHFYRVVTEPDAFKSMLTGYGLKRPPVGTEEELAGRPKKLR